MPNQARSQVLFVDDDPDACEMFPMLMLPLEIDTTCVKSAAEAWLQINKRSFHLMVVDCWLPDVDGFEFCRRVRETDATTPIIFYSGAAYDADRQKGMAAGANAYIAKPDITGLIAAVSNFIVKANAQRSISWQIQPEPAFVGFGVARVPGTRPVATKT